METPACVIVAEQPARDRLAVRTVPRRHVRLVNKQPPGGCRLTGAHAARYRTIGAPRCGCRVRSAPPSSGTSGRLLRRVVGEGTDLARLASGCRDDMTTPNPVLLRHAVAADDGLVLVRLRDPAERTLACVDVATGHLCAAPRTTKFGITKFGHDGILTEPDAKRHFEPPFRRASGAVRRTLSPGGPGGSEGSAPRLTEAKPDGLPRSTRGVRPTHWPNTQTLAWGYRDSTGKNPAP